MSADFLFCKQITEKNSTEHTWNLKFEDLFIIFEKMGKAKKLKISKAPRNTPLEENITKVRLFISLYCRILVKSSKIYTRIKNVYLKLVFQNFRKIPLFCRYYFHFKYILTDLIPLVSSLVNYDVIWQDRFHSCQFMMQFVFEPFLINHYDCKLSIGL